MVHLEYLEPTYLFVEYNLPIHRTTTHYTIPDTSFTYLGFTAFHLRHFYVKAIFLYRPFKNNLLKRLYYVYYTFTTLQTYQSVKEMLMFI